MWTLLVLSIIAGDGRYPDHAIYDWRPMVTNLQSEQACKRAAKKLEYPGKRILVYRCIGPEG